MLKLTFIFLTLILSLTSCQSKKREKEAQIRPNLPSFSKPQDATAKIEGQSVPYCLWYNPNKWMVLETPADADEENAKWDWTLILVDPQNRTTHGKDMATRGSRAYIFSGRGKNLSFDDIKETMQKKFMEGKSIQEFEDLGSEEKLVNGLLVYAWKFKVRIADMGTKIFYNYYYSNTKSFASIITFTNPIFWKENEKDVEDLLNGFCQLKSK